jgi:hypothetical protein
LPGSTTLLASKSQSITGICSVSGEEKNFIFKSENFNFLIKILLRNLLLKYSDTVLLPQAMFPFILKNI